MSGGAVSLADQAREEIFRRHDFFVAWFNGSADEADLTRSLSAFLPSFVRIAPDGSAMTAERLASFLRAKRRAFAGSYATAVEDPETVWAGVDATLLSYVEHQTVEGRESRRRSTALFVHWPAAPHAVGWAHLQETNINPAGT